MYKLRHLLIIGICTLVLTVACSRPPDSSKSDKQTLVSSESCRIVQHEMGETELCGKPQTVAALSPHILDSMLALGVQPVAYAEAENLNIQTYDNPKEQIPYIGKWVTTQPGGLGDRKNPSLERLALVKPDLILGEKWLSKEEYPFLTQIAPTLLFSDKGSDGQQSWQEDIEGIAKALGKTAQVRELLAGFSKQIAQTKAALQPVLQKYPRVFLMTSNLTTYVDSSPKSTTGRLLQKIGFEIVRPEGIEDDTKISWEIIPQIETDIILVLSWSDDNFSNPEDGLRKKWAQNPLLNSMPVFQQGRVYFVDYQLWGSNIRGPLADRLILEALPDLLLDSVKNENSA
ncbi:iron-siderophore ABC transporter substrate-binding protein [Pleurocapsa sp. CCALA 161]|uniref:ABC transporter substrate-binding protein n=1 Tax=Pleurocapsa sp. CCALA 161 TaxID=2107688 RepID=UPI000D058B1B|nr:iron-siderophore ABC transporter substrate-binding protein [Pleurocapsa sp. CCALA 161]PSB09511.1 iron-siderophore ABC transporter substrate-binding protein [Pleurocapsa sp. CCALA 161]